MAPVVLLMSFICSHFITCLPPTSSCPQIFFLLRESELTPSGSNLLDGRFAVFGYVVDGQDSLGVMKVRTYGIRSNRRTLTTGAKPYPLRFCLQVGDKIDFIKVVDGAENFKKGVEKAKPVEANVAEEVAAL